MDVSKNRGTPKWMVYNGNFIKMDDVEVPLFLETSKCSKFGHFHSQTWADATPGGGLIQNY